MVARRAKAQEVVTVAGAWQYGEHAGDKLLRVVPGKDGISSQSNKASLEALSCKRYDPIWF